MRVGSLLIFIVLIATGCYRSIVHTVRLADSRGDTALKNDTIDIEYDFNTMGGQVQFTITNNSDKPIYIDWQRSLLQINNVKTFYGFDALFMNTSYSYAKKVGSGGISGTIIGKKEMVVKLMPGHWYIFTHNFLPEFLRSEYPLSRKEKMHQYLFTAQQAPLQLRNLVVMSFDRDFTSEFKSERSFYAWRIESMTEKYFFGSFNPGKDFWDINRVGPKFQFTNFNGYYYRPK